MKSIKLALAAVLFSVVLSACNRPEPAAPAADATPTPSEPAVPTEPMPPPPPPPPPAPTDEDQDSVHSGGDKVGTSPAPPSN